MHGYQARCLRAIERGKKCHPKKAETDSNSTESANWTDDEVELLLGVVRSYFSQKNHEGLEWESTRRQTLHPGRIASKIKTKRRSAILTATVISGFDEKPVYTINVSDS